MDAGCKFWFVMNLLSETIRLVSEPPGNVIYHLITLFALQIVFALSYSRWRRNEDDDIARRTMWASAVIFLARILLLFVGINMIREPEQLARILPPLDQAINTVTVILIVWSLLPSPARWPRLWDIMLIFALVLTSIFYFFSAQFWNAQIAAGVTYYGGTIASAIWTIIQIVSLISGLIYLLLNSQHKEPLPAAILGILLLFALIHLWNYIELIPTGTNVPYWTRLGYMLALPLWAIYAYQHYLSPLLSNERDHQQEIDRFGRSLNEAAEVIATRQRERRIAKSLVLATQLYDAAFASIGLVDSRNSKRINFASNLINSDPQAINQWAIDLGRHPTLNAALIQGQTIELLASGVGARQLHEFYNACGSSILGPLLIHPLVENGSNVGLLVIAARAEQEAWTDDQKALMPGLAKLICQAIANSESTSVRFEAARPAPAAREVTETVPSAIFIDQVRLRSLEAERNELKSELQEAVSRRKQAEEKALVLQKQARYLAAALKVAQVSLQKKSDVSGSIDDPVARNTESPPAAEDAANT